ncbi:MAG: hypothetical protein M1833_004502 [Piccolia ochrophora]|nr:MAG: hypothetical protein M1833_004502 [Piccolia ochrophora]
MHYSRMMPLVGGQRYFTSTAVFLNEVVKLGICLTFALYDISRNLPPSTPATALFSALYDASCTADSWKLAIPAVLYTLQNSLQYVAISNLDAATFQVTYQLKILATALFSVALLGRSLTPKRWASLVMLTLGVAIVQYAAPRTATLAPLKGTDSKFFFPRSFAEMWEIAGTGPSRAHLTKRSATYEGIDEDMGLLSPQTKMNPSVGLLAVLVACTASGLAGVYFEKVLKDSSSASLWIRNIQLSFYSLFPALLVGVIMKDGEEIAKLGFFSGYNWVVWTAIAFQAIGGVLVALCVNYADNIAKNFATSLSIVISFLASLFFFDFEVTTYVLPTPPPCIFSHANQIRTVSHRHIDRPYLNLPLQQQGATQTPTDQHRELRKDYDWTREQVRRPTRTIDSFQEQWPVYFAARVTDETSFEGRVGSNTVREARRLKGRFTSLTGDVTYSGY